MNMVEAIEAHDMVSAPPDLQSGVFAKLGLKEGSNRQTADSLSNNAATKQTNISTVQSVGDPSVARRKRKFRIYCFKVIGASAAAILIALSLPILSPEKAPTPTKQEVVGSMTATDIGGKDGVVGLPQCLGIGEDVLLQDLTFGLLVCHVGLVIGVVLQSIEVMFGKASDGKDCHPPP